MGRKEKIYKKILDAQSDNNIHFDDLRYLLISMGFSERIRGDHHFMCREYIEEIINIQPRGNKAKSYQVKQVRGLIIKYHLEV
ncbi:MULTISPECIES: type II toxin-antitoxin system HicA family toxin [Eubacteriales]|uniref:type II toxin-antitoxin system HicA family toxin n=1 Tax=Eubacteriales TaxID=186802 RepID=UPI0011064926|nr:MULTISPECIES: type II toxin-antitoxin system HicA family toxin [Eubacteriales]